jgi:hypothetical protein
MIRKGEDVSGFWPRGVRRFEEMTLGEEKIVADVPAVVDSEFGLCFGGRNRCEADETD